jgi:hypothetical protein
MKSTQNLSKNNVIYREYEKKLDKFEATNNFYIPILTDNSKIEFKYIDIEKKLIPYLNSHIYIDDKDINNYIDLIVISNISFTLNETNINKYEIIKKFIDNNEDINEKILEDLYYNNTFSKKINLELPKKYNNKIISIDNIDIIKKYLFKITPNEIEKQLNYNIKFGKISI